MVEVKLKKKTKKHRKGGKKEQTVSRCESEDSELEEWVQKEKLGFIGNEQ